MSDRSPALRLRQGFVLLAGAIVFSLVVGSGPDTFYWTPLGIGLVYLASAMSGGRQGGYWSGALVLVGWGAAVAYARQARPDLDIAGLYLAGAGLGASAAIAAQRVGIKADALGAALTVVVAGAILALSGEFPELTDARTYAEFVGAVGLVNVAWALLSDPSRLTVSADRVESAHGPRRQPACDDCARMNVEAATDRADS